MFGFIEKLFRRKRSGRMSISAYRKHHERELKRNPRRFEWEQEQARQWSMRGANQSGKEEALTRSRERGSPRGERAAEERRTP